MHTVYTARHALHQPAEEYWEGKVQPFHEEPRRAENILAAVRASRLGPVMAPADFGLAPIVQVHAPHYVEYLQTAYARWIATGRNPAGVHPDTFAGRGLDRRPAGVAAQAGYYSFDVMAVITAGTWEAAYASAQCALTAAQVVHGGERAAFALCRPPGHHAQGDRGGGYCYLNNAAVAAQWLGAQPAWPGRRGGGIAILDIDFHHGNGTQSIFYARGDVLYVSLHADPDRQYPYYLGTRAEQGAGSGQGCTINYPLPAGIADDAYLDTLSQACGDVARYLPDALVVSLGVDTFGGDPIADFGLTGAAYPRIGALLAQLNLPTVFIMEGGYAVEQLGTNVVGVLQSFDAHA